MRIQTRLFQITPVFKMKYYIICKNCGLSYENKEPGKYYCPQCQKIVEFFKLELFDGSKPGKVYEDP
jgi:rubrerythrin